jgi:lysophospholipid acyltransferase (LPLAT)-like uncharacterized protein/HEAT repeat protein
MSSSLQRLWRASLAALAVVALWLLRASWRVRVVGAPPADARLFACWHGDLVALAALPSRWLGGGDAGQPLGMLISRSDDGALATRLAASLGVEAVRGSSSRGAVAGALGLLRRLRRGDRVALAGDGPRGPRRQLVARVGALAQASAATVGLAAARASRAWHLRSWDRLAIPKPFARVVIVWADGGAGQGDLAAALERAGARARREAAGAPGRGACAVVLALAMLACGCDLERGRALEALSSPAAPVRARALHLLGKRRDVALAPRIGKLLRDPSPRVRQAAIAALGAGGIGTQLHPLIETLRDRDLEVRLAAVRVLGDSRRAPAARALLPLARDPSMVVRRAAGQALVALGVSHAEQSRRLARRAVEETSRRLLGARDEQLRAGAARLLGRSGSVAALPALLARQDDPSALVLREVAVALGRIGGAKARAALASLSRSKRSEARLAAAHGLAVSDSIRLPPSHPDARVDWGALQRLAGDPQPEVIGAALAAVARRPSPPPGALVGRLCKQLAAKHTFALRLAAARALGRHGLAARCGEAPAALRRAALSCETQKADWAAKLRQRFELLAALDQAAHRTALVAIARCAFETHRAEAQRWVTRQGWRALGGGKAKRPVLRRRPPKPKDRRKALSWLLSRYPTRHDDGDLEDPLLPPRAAPQLVIGLLEALPAAPAARALLAEVALVAPRRVRIAALRRLGQLDVAPPRSPASSPSTQPASAPSPQAKLAAALRSAIAMALRSKDKTVRRAAARGCVMLQTGLPAGVGSAGARAAALRLLGSKDFEERAAGARCLGQLGDVSAVPLLLAALRKETQLALLRALARLGDHRATQPILKLLGEDHPATRQGERQVVIDALGLLGDPAAAPALERELAHPAWQVRRAAALALARAGRRRSRAALAVCELDYHQVVRVACARARRALAK